MKYRNRLASLLLLVITTGIPPIMVADDEAKPAKPTPPPPIDPNLPQEERAFKAWLRSIEDQHKRTRENNGETMRARLEELKRICDPLPGQLSQFELASKGTVERATQAWLEIQERQWRARRAGKYIRSTSTRDARLDPSQNPVWTHAIASLLDQEQRDAYKAEMGARTQYQARLSILKVIDKVDRKSRLSARQREALLTLVEASLTIPLREVDPRFDEATVKKAFGRVSQEQLQKLLSTEQLTLWNKTTGLDTKEGNAKKFQIKVQ